EEPRLAGQPAEAGRLRARLHPDAKEAELRAAKGGARAPDQRHRGDDVYSRRRPQSAGAFAGPDSWWPRQGSPGRPLSRRARHARRRRRPGPDAGTLEVRSQASEESLEAWKTASEE